MNSFTLLAYVCLVLGTASGCATRLALAPQKQDDQELSYNQGKPVLFSTKQHQVSACYLGNSHPIFYINTLNDGSKSFSFGPENIRATIGGKSLPVITYEQKRRQIENAQVWMAVAAGISAGSANIAAAQPSYTYGPGSTTWTTYNPAATSLAQSQNNLAMHNQIAANAAMTQVQLGAIESYLRTTTVQPKQIVGGVVELQPKNWSKGKQLILEVTLPGDEVHNFAFDLTESR